MKPEFERIFPILFPYAARKLEKLQQDDLHFAYYTNAETAWKILRNREIWMRDARTLNDFREIEYGESLVKAYYNGSEAIAFRHTIDSIFPGASAALANRLNQSMPHIRASSFLTCFSEHPRAENNFGRLSMWRAYGRSNGVALVLRRDFFGSESPALGIFSSPVAYLDYNGVAAEFAQVVDNVGANADLLKSLGRDLVMERIFQAFHFAMLSLKHPGFCEEREWRAILSPVFAETNKYQRVAELINGIPQTVIKVPLRDWPEDNIVGLALPNLLSRVIIGPSQFPNTIAQALDKEMTNAGISDSAEKIKISDIPLRT